MKTKNLFLGVLAMTGMLFATSCSQDEVLLNEPSNENFVSATFTINSPVGIDTRAIGEADYVNKVVCATYDKDGVELTDLRQYLTVQDKKAEYSIRLVKGQNYRVAFFAYCAADGSDAPIHYDVTDLKEIKVLDAQSSNVEKRDAFTAYTDVKTGETMQPINRTVTLYRPFAQLNFGSETEDWNAAVSAGVEVVKTKVIVSNVYKTFSAYEDVVVGDAETMTFALNDIPAQDLSANGKVYKYLAMNYLLVGDAGSEKTLTDVTFEWLGKNGETNDPVTTFTNIPVQRNYRTNIIGYLLTNPAKFNIVVEEAFENEDYNVSIWDGVTTTPPTADAEGVYRISTAEQLVGMMLDSKYPNCNNYQNVVLECNIDLGGNTITGFGDDSGFFDGIFDGQGYTISNFKIDATSRTYYAGLFNQVSQYSGTNTVIKNLIVKNAQVSGTSQVGVIVGGMNGNTVVENCKVYNSTVSAVKKVGSVVGYTAGGTVTGNYAEDCTVIYSEKEAGEILGFENTGSTVNNNTFKNVAFKASAAALAKELTPVGGVINITRDYIVTGDWTSLTSLGTVTINGNGHTISGINKPLIAGNATLDLTINDLTIAESQIGVAAVENGLGTGAFISYQDAGGVATFNNCHLLNSSVTGNERAGGFIAYTSGSKVTITDCSVVGCEMTAVGGAAGFVAYNQAEVVIENSNVEGTTVEATEDRTGKKALAGAVIGTVNGNTTFTNVTVSNNTVKNTGATAESDLVGRVFSGTLTVN